MTGQVLTTFNVNVNINVIVDFSRWFRWERSNLTASYQSSHFQWVWEDLTTDHKVIDFLFCQSPTALISMNVLQFFILIFSKLTQSPRPAKSRLCNILKLPDSVQKKMFPVSCFHIFRGQTEYHRLTLSRQIPMRRRPYILSCQLALVKWWLERCKCSSLKLL